MPVLINSRHELFAQELAKGKSASEAYELAGFQPDRGNASRLQQQDDISQRIAEILSAKESLIAQSTAKAVEKLALTKEWVIAGLVENAQRALQRVAVLDGDGVPTGEYRYEGHVANRAFELLGKELGMFIDRKEVGEPGEFAAMEDDALMAELRREAQALGVTLGDLAGRQANGVGRGRNGKSGNGVH